MANKKEKPEKEEKKDPKSKKKKKKTTPQKRGPKSKIQDDKIVAARYMAMCGMTDEQIADELGIAVSTLYLWKKKYKELSEALKNGKFVADGKVVEGLYKKATGFEYDEVTYTTIKYKTTDKEGGVEEKETEETEIKRTRKFIPPDSTSIIYWLNNRRPGLWRNVNHIKHSGAIGGENAEIQQQLENNPEAADALKKLYRLHESVGGPSQD